MFYGEGSDKPLFLLREMIMSKTVEERTAALDKLAVYVKKDIKATMEAMDGLPVTIRLLDPPLHEFVPHGREKLEELADELRIDMTEVHERAESLRESNPMLGHRGVRLGITYPEISEMQIRVILESAAELNASGRKIVPEIMIPVTCDVAEIINHKAIADRVHAEVCKKKRVKKIPFMYGTMIEIPRAALKANEMAGVAEFFSFGTNDLTQMTFGFSRDDVGSFLPYYLKKKILKDDPFQTLDQSGVGELIKIAIERGRSVRPKLKVGICGEHGGDPESVKFCHRAGMDYVSCSPFRVPIARLAAAQAALEERNAGKAKSPAAAKRGGKRK
jgi:pyruvate,orthophosphate dikinase